ncbi:hypothetical protein F4679DRAFT_598488 [Xylaria curta]|nr:hypothetical protein F4679DRAFT_598488 [Xylaria curta]
MASPKPFETNAFDLTPEEKHENLVDVKTMLVIAGSRIQKAKDVGASRNDWLKTLNLVNDALILAEDPDACDPTDAPVITCHLYAGDCLLALNKESRAYSEYEKAATGVPHAFIDQPSVEIAAKRMQEMQVKPKEEASTKPPS